MHERSGIGIKLCSNCSPGRRKLCSRKCLMLKCLEHSHKYHKIDRTLSREGRRRE